jgi:hypothetical protein
MQHIIGDVRFEWEAPRRQRAGIPANFLGWILKIEGFDKEFCIRQI